ncbi:TPA: calcium-translocating P-type ATPase, PMCA-type [Candidatus Micrarchaeota archaeon]|nr:calcium-translocating P-type ATPase, PMCA-type [Candidatus Micrarchaeota archaeon]
MTGGRWHSVSLLSVFSELGTSEKGLSEKKAWELLEKLGPNSIQEVKKEPWYAKFLSQFRSLPILMLLAAAAISLALGLTLDRDKLIDAAAILVAVFIAVSFGFWQEYKAERALEALKKMVVLHSIVVRGGRQLSINSRELVVGDMVILEEGSAVPADLRLVEAINLASDQSMLTGESRPASKEACTVPAKSVLSDQRNMLFSGTVIVRGHCKGVVVTTGMQTEFGKIVGYVTEKEKGEAPLQRNISQLSRYLGYAGITAAILFFGIGLLRGESASSMFVVAVTLAVAVIPEGLPTVLAITLALGVQKMAKRNAIVRKMSAVEALGSATVICTDKTGTITQNRMEVQEIILSENAYTIGKAGMDEGATRRDAVLARAVEVMALCNNAIKVSEAGVDKFTGDPTETALLSAVEACGASEKGLRSEHKEVGEIPFDSDRKMMSSVRMWGRERIALVKGAPEKVLPRCKFVLMHNGEKKLTGDTQRKFATDSQSLGNMGMRVLALAYRKVEKKSSYSSANTESGLVLVGLVAMEDPPRPEAAEAIALCRSAGIKVVMITGDSLSTARAIAAKVGLLEEGGQVMDGSALSDLSEQEFERIVPSISLFSRVTPEQKYKIVQTYMKRDEIVAVTGDGVNDSPAIKKADIGVAMGLAGTDVTKEVSDIVLTDDNFASIVSAVKYGRTIFNNIKSFVRYQLSTNVAALSLMFAGPVFTGQLPLIPVQILWINIMIDGPPALALGAEPPSKDEMNRPPRNPKAGFMSRNLVISILVLGLVMASISLAVFGYYRYYSPEKATTVVFTLFVFLQLMNALNCRSGHESIFRRFFSNRYIYLAITASLALHLAIVYAAPLQEVFKTVPLSVEDLLLVAGASALIMVLEESKKKFLPFTTAY